MRDPTWRAGQCPVSARLCEKSDAHTSRNAACLLVCLRHRAISSRPSPNADVGVSSPIGKFPPGCGAAARRNLSRPVEVGAQLDEVLLRHLRRDTNTPAGNRADVDAEVNIRKWEFRERIHTDTSATKIPSTADATARWPRLLPLGASLRPSNALLQLFAPLLLPLLLPAAIDRS